MKTEFGIEHVGASPSADSAKRQRTSTVVPSGAWFVNSDGKKLCEPVSGEGHDTGDGEAATEACLVPWH